jgi:hypothetical protein
MHAVTVEHILEADANRIGSAHPLLKTRILCSKPDE